MPRPPAPAPAARLVRAAIGGLLLTLAVAGCQWPVYGHDLAHTNNNTLEKAIGPGTVGQLREAWRIDGARGVTSTPTVFGSEVFFGAWDGTVRAVDRLTGAQRWQTSFGNVQIDGTVAVDADRAYVGDSAGVLHAVDRVTGAPRWATRLDDHPETHIYSSPVPVNGLVLIGVASDEWTDSSSNPSFRGSIVAVSAATGQIVWQRRTTNNDATAGAGGGVWSTPAVDPARGLLYIGTGQGYESPAGPLTDSLIAIEIATGEIRWHRQYRVGDVYTIWRPRGGQDADLGASPTLFRVGGRDLVGAGDKAGYYAAFDRDSGEKVWERPLPSGGHLGGIMATPAYADGTLFLSDNDWGFNETNFHDPAHKSTTFALDAATGQVRWSRLLSSPTFGALSVANGVVYQPTVDGTLHALSAADGSVLWETGLGADMAGGASIVDGRVYVGYGFWFSLTTPSVSRGGVVSYALP